MPKLIKNDRVIEDDWQVIAADHGENAPLPQGKLIVPLKLWQSRKAELAAHSPIGVWLDSDEEPAAIAGEVDVFDVVAVNFPLFNDGRGFTSGRELRQRYGYRGELRAIGAFIRDQLFFLKRCGFDSYALETSDPETALESFNDFSDVYQGALDQPVPLMLRK